MPKLSGLEQSALFAAAIVRVSELFGMTILSWKNLNSEKRKVKNEKLFIIHFSFFAFH
jgi:hypothetical protein